MRRTSSNTCCTTSGASPAEGSSISSSFGPRHQRAADGAHLLLAARQRAGQLLAAILEPGKQLVDPRRAARRNARRARGMKAPMRRFSSTLSRGNSRRFSGTCAMPCSTMRCAGRPPSRTALEVSSRPPRIGTSPEMTRISVVLPAPLGPMTPTASPLRHLERNVEQGAGTIRSRRRRRRATACDQARALAEIDLGDARIDRRLRGQRPRRSFRRDRAR